VDQQLASYAKTLKDKPLKEFVIYPVSDSRISPPSDKLFTSGSRIDGYDMKGDKSSFVSDFVAAAVKNNIIQKGGTLGFSGSSEHLSKDLLTQLAKKYQIVIAVRSADYGINFYLPDGTFKTDPSQTFGPINTRGSCSPGLQPARNM
jgi:hypothetical protein